MKLKKSLQQKAKLHKKGMAILVKKAACFKSNNYKDVSTKELDILLQWYGVDKKGMKKAEKVSQCRAIQASNTEPPQLDMWMAEDKERLAKLQTRRSICQRRSLDGMPLFRREMRLQLFLTLVPRNGSL
jgi:hypothetical protein